MTQEEDAIAQAVIGKMRSEWGKPWTCTRADRQAVADFIRTGDAVPLGPWAHAAEIIKLEWEREEKKWQHTS